MGKVHVVGIGMLLFNSLIEVILLGSYASKQNDLDQVYNTAVDGGQIFTVGFNGCMLTFSLILAIYLYNKHLGRFNFREGIGDYDDRHFMCSIILFVTIVLTVIFLLFSFGLHCGITGCFKIETPLYVMALVNMFVLSIGGGVAIVLGVLYAMWDFFCGNIWFHRKNRRIPNSGVTMSYEVVQKILGGEGLKECGVCQKMMTIDSDFALLVCGHYFHAGCSVDNKKCVVCEGLTSVCEGK